MIRETSSALLSIERSNVSHAGFQLFPSGRDVKFYRGHRGGLRDESLSDVRERFLQVNTWAEACMRNDEWLFVLIIVGELLICLLIPEYCKQALMSSGFFMGPSP